MAFFPCLINEKYKIPRVGASWLAHPPGGGVFWATVTLYILADIDILLPMNSAVEVPGVLKHLTHMKQS